MSSYPTTTNYSGRQIDLELLQSIAVLADQRVQLSSFTKPPKIVAGIEKLAQRYALLFLSSVNTIRFAQDQGTDFMQAIAGGTVQRNDELLYLFASASGNVLQQMQRDDAELVTFGTVPDDEQIVDASLLDYEVNVATATILLRIQLTSAAGASITFIVPTTAPR